MDISLGSTEPIQIPEDLLFLVIEQTSSLGPKSKTLLTVQPTNTAFMVTEEQGKLGIQQHYNENLVFYNNMSTHDYNYLTFNDDDANYGMEGCLLRSLHTLFKNRRR